MEKPIRVLQILTIMNRGGAETMIMNYFRAIDKTKVQFDFLLHRNEKGAFDDEIKSLGGRIYYMPAINPANYYKYKKKLDQFFKEHPYYSIVHSHLNALSSIVLNKAKKNNVKTRIAHSHIAVEPYVIRKIFKKNTDIKALLKDTIQSLVSKQVKKYATHYFACGEKAGVWLFGQENLKNIKIINNAINAKEFIYDPIIKENLKSELNITEKLVIGHVGRFNEQKNHFFLIDIFNEVAKKNKNIVLVLVGTGNLKEKIEEKISKLNLKERVLLLGVRKDVTHLLQAFDLFLFPSLYEGLPVTLVEAQASGLKVIASDAITNEIAITNLITFLSINDNPALWAVKILEQINYTRQNTYNTIAKNHYDIFENADKLESFYLDQSK